jgi:hypothetical protein
MEAEIVYNKFNRGEVDSDALARDDVAKVKNSCELMENFLPLRLGPMIYRPGFQNLDTVTDEAYFVEFIASTADTALLEFTNNQMRIWIDDALLARTAVATQVPDSSFTGGPSPWTDGSGAGSTATVAGGYGNLTGNTSTSGQLWQTIASTDTGNEHTVNITIEQSPVLVKIGTSGQNSDEIFSGTLLPGVHSLVFTPASNVTFTLSNSLPYLAKVAEVVYSTTKTQTFTTAITTAELSTIRYSQSADIIYITHDNGLIIQVERRGVKSWSLVDFRADDGPFDIINDSEVTLAAAALSGDTTLTASSNYFKSSHVGSLFKLGSSSQTVTASVTAEDNGTGSIRVTGASSGREFIVTMTGGTGGTVATLQRSTDDVSWIDIASYTAAATSYDDGLDNSILYYRLHVKTGDYFSGTAVLTLEYAGGSVEGIARVTAYTSSLLVNAQVLTDFGSTDATLDWYAGQWSDIVGYPTANKIYEGRLWLAGKNNVWGSVSDAYSSFDRDIEGDSKSIFKTIGFGPVDSVNWLIDSGRLIMGIASDEISVRSSSFGEVLTQTNINLKSGSSQGSSPISPLRIDDKVYYTQRSGVKIIEAEYGLNSDAHGARDLMTLNQNICSAGIKRIAVSRQPETRIYVVLDDGSARVYLFDPAEDVASWSRITTPNSGLIEDVVVLPSTGEDRVYFTVNRGGTRYLEKMAKLSEFVDKHTDSFKAYTSPGTTISGLSHLEGLSVNVWADSQDRGEFTVSSGAITVGSSWTDVIVGLKYNADYTSNKLGQYANYSVLNKRVRVFSLGMIIRNLAPGALKYGYDLNNLDIMPEIEEGAPVSATALIEAYDQTPFEFNGDSEVDSRVSLRATGPCKIMAITYGIKDSTRSPDKQKRPKQV